MCCQSGARCKICSISYSLAELAVPEPLLQLTLAPLRSAKTTNNVIEERFERVNWAEDRRNSESKAAGIRQGTVPKTSGMRVAREKKLLSGLRIGVGLLIAVEKIVLMKFYLEGLWDKSLIAILVILVMKVSVLELFRCQP